MAPRDLGFGHGPERGHRRLGQITILRRGLLRRHQPTQQMHTDPEMPLLLPDAGRIERLFMIPPRQLRNKLRGQGRSPRPGSKEIAAQNRVKHAGMARQILRKPRRCCAYVNNQLHKGRIGLK